MSKNTTVRVSAKTRDRLNANAKKAGNLTIDANVRLLMDRDDWRHKMLSAQKQMKDADSDTEYQPEPFFVPLVVRVRGGYESLL